MALLIATRDGVYRAEEASFEEADRVLDCGQAPRVRTFSGIDGVFATSKQGLFHSTDGVEWHDLEVPAEEVWEVLSHEGALYAGTYPAAIYRSTDDGESWTELSGLQDVPNRERWRNPFGPDGRVRTLTSPPGSSDRLLVGIEAGGFFVSDDRGETWTERDVGDQHDFHQIVALGPEEYLVVCGRLSVTDMNHGANMGGLFHTTDGGESFQKLDDAVEPSYFREVLVHDGTLFACGSLTIPPTWIGGLPAEGRLFESKDFETFVESEYPGGPEELILAWGVHEGRVVAGTAGGGIVGPGEPKGGRVIARQGAGDWVELGPVRSDVHSLVSF
jgi:hypothetical protein